MPWDIPSHQVRANREVSYFPAVLATSQGHQALFAQVKVLYQSDNCDVFLWMRKVGVLLCFIVTSWYKVVCIGGTKEVQKVKGKERGRQLSMGLNWSLIADATMQNLAL